MTVFFEWLFRKKTYESEFKRGKREAKDYAKSNGLINQRIALGSARCDRDFCQGADKGFPDGWIYYMSTSDPLSYE